MMLEPTMTSIASPGITTKSMDGNAIAVATTCKQLSEMVIAISSVLNGHGALESAMLISAKPRPKSQDPKP